MSIAVLQFKLDTTPAKAKEIANQYWAAFPRIRPWLFEITAQADRIGHIRYWSGRMWWEESPSHTYKGANALIQGGCADVLSIAAMRVNQWLEDTGYGEIISLVHDEIIVEAKEEVVPEVVTGMREIMTMPDLFNLPWFTDAKVGPTYGSLKDWANGE